MVPREIEIQILRLYHVEKWPVGTIASQLAVHHSVVERVIAEGSAPRPRIVRPSIADDFIPFIRSTLEKYPRLPASRLFVMVRERGYRGRPSHFRDIVRRFRPSRPAEAYLRLRTLPGEQGQADWAHFGTMDIGRAKRRLLGFVFVLSYSRALFLRFFLGQTLPFFLRGHQQAFHAFGGLPRIILYDNLRSVVQERYGDAIHFHRQFLDFAGHYRFEPRPVAVGRGNEKPRVERAILYIRTSFLPGRTWQNLDDLNHQADRWRTTEVLDRRWVEDPRRTVREVFVEEQQVLLPLPDDDFCADEHVEARVDKTPYVRFDLNDYSVPHEYVRRTVTIRATLVEVRIFFGTQLIATHQRSYDKGCQIEDPLHIKALGDAKRHARTHRGLDRLRHAVPLAEKLLTQLAERGRNLGNATVRLLQLLDAYGPRALRDAIAEALAADTPHLHAIRLILDRSLIEKGLPPPLALQLPADPRIRDLAVNPHELDGYDQLHDSDRKDHDDDDDLDSAAAAV